ncbi:hypothetical protein MTsPCn5_37020 [Croceitalea sp. MTPC5]|nr:hypothetical protein MTsPCn5_37020 [Croceitalea sp. MTPC5]
MAFAPLSGTQLKRDSVFGKMKKPSVTKSHQGWFKVKYAYDFLLARQGNQSLD